MLKFILLTKHTDKEMTLILQKYEDEGLRLVKVRGNFFFFEKNEKPGTVCSYSFFPKGRHASTAVQMAEECVYLRENGWNTLCTCLPETLADTKRHVFLIKEHDGASDIKPNPKKEKKVKNKARFRAVSSVLLCLLYLTSFIFLLSHDFYRIASSNIYFFTCLIAAPAMICSMVLCIMSMVEQYGKKPKRLRILDISSLFVFILLALFALFLVTDSMWNSRKTSSERVKIGSTTYVLYNDDIPLTLEDFGINPSGSYRTKRMQSSSGILGSYVHYFDESFGVESTDVYSPSVSETVAYISVSEFKSDYSFILKTVARQFEKNNPSSKITMNDNSITVIKSGFPLD